METKDQILEFIYIFEIIKNSKYIHYLQHQTFPQFNKKKSFKNIHPLKNPKQFKFFFV